MRASALLLGLGYAALALVLAGIVIAPVFLVVGMIYAGGDGLVPLLIAVIVAWAILAILLRRRRISL